MSRSVDNDKILSFLTKYQPYLHALASRYCLEYDDLKQEAALVLLELPDHIQIEQAVTYILTAFRNRAVGLWRRSPARRHHRSLSSYVRGEDGDTVTLADVLPSSEMSPEESILLREDVEQLHEALRCCPLEEQRYMKRVARLDTFLPDETRSDRPSRSISSIRQSAYRRLRSSLVGALP